MTAWFAVKGDWSWCLVASKLPCAKESSTRSAKRAQRPKFHHNFHDKRPLPRYDKGKVEARCDEKSTLLQ